MDDYGTAIEVKVELKNEVSTMSLFLGCHYSYGHTRSLWQWKYSAGLCHGVCIEHNAEFCPDLQSLAPHTGGWFAASSGNWIVSGWRDRDISLAVSCLGLDVCLFYHVFSQIYLNIIVYECMRELVMYNLITKIQWQNPHCNII